MATVVRRNEDTTWATTTMIEKGRAAVWGVVAVSLVLLAFMTYALTLGDPSWRPWLRGSDTLEVAVFYPDVAGWRSVRAGAHSMVDRGAVVLKREDPTRIDLMLPDTGKTLRITWYQTGGTVETKRAVEETFAFRQPPIAYVGSSNTALTIALARPLANRARNQLELPGILLLPDASAVEFAPHDSRRVTDSETLLGQYPGRTFRFCLNNARLAELLMGYLRQSGESSAQERLVVVDERDPCSVDLARWWDRASASGTDQATSRWLRVSPSADETQTASDEAQIASAIASAAAAATPARPLVMLLALQGEPARRMLAAVEAALPLEHADRLRVVTGDGLGLTSLEQLAGSLSFSLACASSLSPGVGPDSAVREWSSAQIHAEWIGALAALCDQRPFPADLASALSELNIQPADRQSAGRPIAFQANERAEGPLGCVLELAPTSGGIHAWSPPESADPSPRWRRHRWIARMWRLESGPATSPPNRQ